MLAYNEETRESWIIETTNKCEITDFDLAMEVIAEQFKSMKRYCKHLDIGHRPFRCKRYDLDAEGQIGTKTKLAKELKWWMENGYKVVKIAWTHNWQIIIDTEMI